MQNRSRPWEGLGFFALFAACSALLRLPHFGNPAPDFDEQLYHLIGSRMLDGYVPYVDLWDRKPIGLFLIYAFGALISGGSVYGYQVLAALSAGATGWLAFAISRRFAGYFASIVAGLLCLLAFPMYYGPVGQSEVFYIPLTLLMLMLTLQAGEAQDDRRFLKLALLAMAVGGLSLQVKYTTVFVCMACGIPLTIMAWVRFRDPVRVFVLVAAFAALGLLPTVMAALAYAAMGQLDAFLFANFFSILERGRPTGDATELWGRVILVKALLPGCAAAAGVALMLVRRGLDWRKLVVLGYSAAALLSYFALGSAYPYYFIPAATGINLVAVWFLNERWVGRIVAILLLAVAVWAGRIFPQWHEAAQQKAVMKQLVKATEGHVSRRNCLYVFDGPTALYSLVETCMPTRFIYADHLNNALESGALGVDQTAELERVLADRPGVIVTAPSLLAAQENRTNRQIVDLYLEQHCSLIANVALSSRPVSAYGCARQ